MRILKLEPFQNGSHDNYEGAFASIPDGWAVIPDEMETPNFPFGTVGAEEIDGVMTVTAWTAGTIPEPDPQPQPDPQPTIADRMTAVEEAVEILLSGRTE